MQTLEQLRRSLKTTTDIKSVVSTMKSLAAARIRQFESVANATQSYTRSVECALQVMLQHHDCPSHLLPNSSINFANQANTKELNKPPKSIGIILLGTDQGCCGRFNANIVEFLCRNVQSSSASSDRAIGAVPKGPDRKTQDSLPPLDPPSPTSADVRLVCMGMKLAAQVNSKGFSFDGVFSVPASVPGISDLVHQLLPAINQWLDSHRVETIRLVYHQRQPKSPPRIVDRQLLPFSNQHLVELKSRPWQSQSLPMLATIWPEMLSSVVQQWLFIRVYRSVAESLASENTSRIGAMQNAEANIDERLTELNSNFNQARQRAITDEIREIVSAACSQD